MHVSTSVALHMSAFPRSNSFEEACAAITQFKDLEASPNAMQSKQVNVMLGSIEIYREFM